MGDQLDIPDLLVLSARRAAFAGADPGRPVRYAKAVGEKLQDVRRQRGLSLRAVEKASEGEFKASVLGLYERGTRMISVPRLARLADLYRVPVDQLLPDERRAGAAPVRIGLARLAALDSPHRHILQRYVHSIEIQRHDFNGRVITIRDADVQALAWILDIDVASLRTRLHDLHVDCPPPSGFP